LSDIRRAFGQYLAQFEIEASLWPTFFVGLFLRLLLMPFTAHSDLIHMYWISSRAAFGYDFTFKIQAFLIFIHAIYLRIASFLIPYFSQVWVDQPDFINFNFRIFNDWFNFIARPEVYRVLFVFKLPYLIFDIGCLILLLYLIPKGSGRNRGLKYWLLTPILLFAVYIFGRHETVAIFFVLLSLLLIKKEKNYYGLLSLGVAIAIRYYSLLLLPIYLLSLDISWRKRIVGAAISLAPWGLVSLITWINYGFFDFINFTQWPHDNILLPLKIAVAPWDNVYIFPFLYLLILLHRFSNTEIGLVSLQQYCLVALMIMFGTTYIGQSPQYWAWVLPFLVLGIASNRQLVPLHILQLFFLGLYSFIGNRATAGYLFAPIAPDFFIGLPGPIDLLQNFISPELFISLSRTAFSAVTFWMAYLVFREIKSTIHSEPPVAVINVE
jgi:hypothetical protein